MPNFFFFFHLKTSKETGFTFAVCLFSSKMVASFGVSLRKIVLQQISFLHSGTSPLPTLSLMQLYYNP